MIENLQGVGMRDELLADEPNSGPSPEHLINVFIIVTWVSYHCNLNIVTIIIMTWVSYHNCHHHHLNTFIIIFWRISSSPSSSPPDRQPSSSSYCVEGNLSEAPSCSCSSSISLLPLFFSVNITITIIIIVISFVLLKSLVRLIITTIITIITKPPWPCSILCKAYQQSSTPPTSLRQSSRHPICDWTPRIIVMIMTMMMTMTMRPLSMKLGLGPFSQLPLGHSTEQPWLSLPCQAPNHPDIKSVSLLSICLSHTFWVRPKSATLARRFLSRRTFLAARSLWTRKWVSR